MITANVCCVVGSKTLNYGDHRFAALPRIDDAIMLYIDGEPENVSVAEIYHFPKPLNGRGPEGEPGLTIRVVGRP